MWRRDRDDEQHFFLNVLNAAHEPLGGLVDIQITSDATGASVAFNGRDASHEIGIDAPQRVPPGLYTIDGADEDRSGFGSEHVRIGREGPYRFSVMVSPPGGDGSGPRIVKGHLLFDHGLPAAGISVRLYAVGFAGQDRPLTETRTGSQGDDTFSYHGLANLHLRVLDAAQTDVTISATKFNHDPSGELQVVVPGAL